MYRPSISIRCLCFWYREYTNIQNHTTNSESKFAICKWQIIIINIDELKSNLIKTTAMRSL